LSVDVGGVVVVTDDVGVVVVVLVGSL